MARYYFDIKEDDVLVPDEEGMDFPTLEDVQREAVNTLSGLAKHISYRVKEPGPQKTSVEVRDKNGDRPNGRFPHLMECLQTIKARGPCSKYRKHTARQWPAREESGPKLLIPFGQRQPSFRLC